MPFSSNCGIDFWLLGLDVAQIAAIGDACYYGGRRFTVQEMDGHRISKVKIEDVQPVAQAGEVAV